jgi:hypothetical protein
MSESNNNKFKNDLSTRSSNPSPLILLKAINYSGSGAWNDETGNNNNAILLDDLTSKNQLGNGIVLNGRSSWSFPNLDLGNSWSAGIWYKKTLSKVKWIIGGGTVVISQTLKYTTDGTTWTYTNNNPFGNNGSASSIAFSGSLWVAVGNGEEQIYIAYSSNGIDWTPTPTANIFPAGYAVHVAYNGSSWITVGAGTNKIVRSTDGINWTVVTNQPFATAIAIAGNNSLWIAGGQSNYGQPNNITIAYSTDGINWTASNDSPFYDGYCVDIACNSSIWVAVGFVGSSKSATIAWSTNGVMWNVVNNPLYGGYGRAIVWNGTIWVAGGNSADNSVSIVYSTDAINWYAANNNPFPGQYCFSIAWDNTQFIAVGPDGISYSTNGLDWSVVYDPYLPYGHSRCICAAGNDSPNGSILNQAIVSGNSALSIGHIDNLNNFSTGFYNNSSWYANNTFTLNPNNWTNIQVTWDGSSLKTYINNTLYSTGTPGANSPNSNSSYTIGNGVFGEIGEVRIYNYALTQSQVTIDYNESFSIFNKPLLLLKALDYSGVGTWNDESGNNNNATLLNGTIAKNNVGSSIILNGGTTWKFNDIGLENSWSVGVWYKKTNNFGPRWVVGVSGTILYSSDGINWSRGNISNFISGQVAYNGSLWVSVGANSAYTQSIMTSIDGTNWTPITTNYLSPMGTNIRWNGSQWLASNNSQNKLVYSSNGTTWFNSTNRPFANINTIAGYGSKWVVGGTGISYSTDGNNWTSAANNPFPINNCILITGSAAGWVAFGYGIPSTTLLLAYSSNGSNWTVSANYPFSTPCAGIAHNGTNWVVIAQGLSIINIAYSSNGINWTASANNPFSGGVSGIASSNSIFVAIGALGSSYSLDGITWSPHNVFLSLDTSAIAGGFTVEDLNGSIITQDNRGAFKVGHINDATNFTTGFHDNSWQTSTSFALTLNKWYNIQATWDGTTLNTYINNVLNSTNTISSTAANSFAQYLIGKNVVGEIGEVKIYNYAIPQLLLTNDYNLSFNTYDTLVLLKATNYSGSGKWYDESGNSNNATFVSGTISKNKDGTGIVLDGSTTWTFPNISIANSWTVGVWFKKTPLTNNDGSYGSILSQTVNSGNNAFFLGHNNSTSFSAGFYKNSSLYTGTNFTLSNTNWKNIQVTWNGTSLLTYVNSTLVSTNNLGQTAIDSTLSYIIGTNVIGEIGEIRMYNYPLSQSQITFNYNDSINTYNTLVLLRAISYSGSGVWYDDSGNNNNATFVSGAIAKNADGNGIVLNGSTTWSFSNISVGNLWSIGLWYKSTASSFIGSILSQQVNSGNNAIYVGHNNSNSFSAGFYKSSSLYTGTNFTLANNVWKNIQITWDGTSLLTYINKVLVSTNLLAQTATDSTLGYIIGNNVAGEIGEIRIYNYAITQAQVNYNYDSSFNAYTPLNPLILLKAIDYSGSGSWNDESGNNYNATLSSGAIIKNLDGDGIILNGSTSWTFPNIGNGNLWTSSVWYKKNNTVPLWLLFSVGVSFSILCSYDGNNWFTPNNNLFSFGSCVNGGAWNGQQWVIGGNQKNNVCIAYSPDGLNWTASANNPFLCNTGPFGVCNGVAWNGSLWVAVGANCNVGNWQSFAWSTNGINWTPSSNNPFYGSTYTGVGLSVAWNGSLWVATGFNENNLVCIAYSTTGKSWTAAANNPFVNGVGRSIAWNGSIWVAGGNSGDFTVSLAYSSDGINWTVSANNPFEGGNNRDVKWNGTIWLASGYSAEYSSSNVCFAYSTNGINWTVSADNPFRRTCNSIAWNGTYWIATGIDYGSSSIGAFSTDGNHWTIINSLTKYSTDGAMQGYGIAYGGSIIPDNSYGSILTQTTNVAGGALNIGHVNDANNFSGGFYYNSTWYTGATFTLSPRVWTNIQITWNGTNLITYINGVPVNSTTITAASSNLSSFPYLIGGNANSKYVAGEIGEVRIHSNTLSSSQILSIYNTSVTSFIKPPSLLLLLSGVNYSGSGQWLDQSGNSYNATLGGGTITKNVEGNGIVLNGSTYWTLPNIPVGASWSISIWYKPYAINTTASIITANQASGINLFINQYNTSISGGFVDTTQKSCTGISNPIDRFKWVNIQITWDGTNLTTYINKISIGSTIPGGNSSDKGATYYIGKTYGTNNNYVTGEIGEIRIYNYALNQSQVDDNFITSQVGYLYNPLSILVDTPITFNNYHFSIYEQQNTSTTPLLISGLKAWYDGADSSSIIKTNTNVTQWNDKSGNNYNATVDNINFCPTLNNNGGINFSGIGYFNLPNNALPTGNAQYTIIVVCTNINGGGLITGGNGNWGTTNGVNSVEINNSNYAVNTWSNNTLTSSSTLQSGINIIYAAYNSTRSMYLNTNVNTDTPGTRSQPNTNNTIGYSTPTGFFNGIIHEIIVYTSALTTTNRQLIEGYLTWKWNITKYLPWVHPYKLNQPSTLPANSFSPLSFLSLSSWYDVGNSSLVSWYDFGDSTTISSNGTTMTVTDKNYGKYNLTQTNGNLPKYVSGKGLVFDGTMNLRNNSFALNLNVHSIYLVFEQTTQVNNAGILGFLASNPVNDTDLNATSINTGSGSNNFNLITKNINVSPTNTTTTTNVYSIIGIADLRIYYNGVLNSTTSNTVANGTSAGLIIGSRFINSTATTGLNGILKEIIIYNVPHETEDQQKLEGYLAWKWNIETKLPANHPYVNIPPGTNSKILDPNVIQQINLGNNPGSNVWLDGNIQKVGMYWHDSSIYNATNGLAYTGIRFFPNPDIIPNMSSIEFYGDNEYFYGSLVCTTSYSISFVFSMDPTVNSNGRIISLYNSGSNDYNNTSSIGIGNNNGQICLYYNNTTSTLTTISTNTFYIMSYIIDNVTGNVYTYLNGTLMSTNQLNISLNTQLIAIGGDANGNNFSWTGFINEVALYPYALRNDDRQTLEGYLGWKWRLNANLPTNHPYYSIQPITSIPSFQPNQIPQLDLWHDANDLINSGLVDNQRFVTWPNRSLTSSFYGNSTSPGPLFNRWGLNGLPTITYAVGVGGSSPSTNIINNVPVTYKASTFTFMGISRSTGSSGVLFRVATSNPSGTGSFGYSGNRKNYLNFPYGMISTANSILTNTLWDNYCVTVDNNSTIQFFNYDQKLLLIRNYTTSTINNFFYNGNSNANGQISEVLMYSKALPTYYLQKLQGYLCWKWGLQNNLSLDHPYRFQQPTKDETIFTIKLGGWTNGTNLTTLYLFDTISSTLLTSINNIYGNSTVGFYASFPYFFPQSQNYLTVCTTNNLSTGNSFVIPEPLIVTPKLILNLSSNDSQNNWGYYNTSMTFSWTLTSYYLGNLVDYTDYYSTMQVYYADNQIFNNLSLIGNATLSNNTVSFSFTFNPSVINSNIIYFYFTYASIPNSLNTFVSDKYVFFDKSSLNFALSFYNYSYGSFNTLITNFPTNIKLSGNFSLYVYYSKDDPTYSNNVYSNQTYIDNVTSYNSVSTTASGTISIITSIYNRGILSLELPDTGLYYLTISNRGSGVTRTSNDINVNIALPVYVNIVNVVINYNFGYYDVNYWMGVIGTYNRDPYPFSTIRVFYSTVIATQNNDLTELADSPCNVSTDAFDIKSFNFSFDNSTLLYPSIYFYFTASTDQVPALDSFTHTGIINFYNTMYTLSHYDNTSREYTLSANQWINQQYLLYLYILDSNKIYTNIPPIPIYVDNNDIDSWSKSFTFDFHYLESGTYYIAISDSDLNSTIINHIIPTPIINSTTPKFSLIKNLSSRTVAYRINSLNPNNNSFKLTLSTYYPQVHLYYGTTNVSFYDLTPIIDDVTNDNIHIVNPDDNTITFNNDKIKDINTSIHFYASTGPNYTGNICIPIEFAYVDHSSINVTLDHYDISSNIYNLTISGYDKKLLDQPLHVLAIKNDVDYINTNQILTLETVDDSTHTSQFRYSFESNNIYNIIICNSYDINNIPNGDIYYKIPNNIYGFTLNAELTNSMIYPGENSINLNFSIPEFDNNISDLIPYGNILINHSFQQNIDLTQININLYKYQNSGFTIWLDAMDSNTIILEDNLVSEWKDKSGLNNCANNLQTYQPSYNTNNNSISFGDEQFNTKYLDLPVNTFNDTNYYTCSFVFTHSGNNSYLMSKQNDLIGLFDDNGQTFKWNPHNNQQYETNFNDFEKGVRYQMTFSYDGTKYRLWRNGQLFTTVDSLDGNISDNLSVNCRLGAWLVPSAGYSDTNIEIHEFIFNETYLYDDEIQKIEAYLCNKWSINNNDNSYINNIITFSPNSYIRNDTITFKTFDDVINISNTIVNPLINPVLTLDTNISNYHIIKLDNWNSSISNVYLYASNSNKYNDSVFLTELNVINDSNGYYIIVTINPLPEYNYYMIRDVNSDIFSFNLRVSNPNNYQTEYINFKTSPTYCVLNEDNKIVLNYPKLSKINVYTCESLYTTGVVGDGRRDLKFITLLDGKTEIIINPTKLPIYILTSSEEHEFGQSNIIVDYNTVYIKNTQLNGLIDQLNTFTISLNQSYENIELNDTVNIIKYIINDNELVFSYDPGFELEKTFNIINSISKEIYETINVQFIDSNI